MKIYNKNDLSKFYQKQDPNEIIDSYMTTYRKSSNNSILNSRAFTECQKSIGRSINSSRTNVSTIHTKEDMKTKFNNYKDDIKYSINNKLDIKEDKFKRNININNIKYSDINHTISIMSFLPKFKRITKYNNTSQSLITTSRTNPIQIYSKVRELNKYVYQ